MKDYAVAYAESYTPLMAKFPRFFNFWLGQPWLQDVTAKTLGMVDVPLLSTPTLAHQLRGQYAMSFDLPFLQGLTAAERAQHVLIVQDPFTSYYEAQLVVALVELVERLGLKAVMVPFKPNGKPQHVKGFLRQFANTARDAADFLNTLQQLDIPMLGLEPALVLCYRDEYRKILSAQRGDFMVQLPQEWLLSAQAQAAISQQGLVTDDTTEVYHLFSHCTEKTNKVSAEQEWQQVFSGFGLTLYNVSLGCCGMAGSYGHDVSNLAASKAIYAQSWQRALAERDPSRCLATGYSCRSQVKRIDTLQLKHPIRALLNVLA